jgi:hypothetical protein
MKQSTNPDPLALYAGGGIKAKTLSRDRVALSVPPDSTGEIVIFMLPDGGAEACITYEGEVVRFGIAPPEPGRCMIIIRAPDGSVEVQYRDNQ